MDTCIEEITILDFPCLRIFDNKVEEVNESFLNLTGYTEKDFLGRELEALWKPLLRLNIEPDRIKDGHKCNCYMFDVDRKVHYTNS